MAYKRGDLLRGIAPGTACFYLVPNRGWDDKHNELLGHDPSFSYLAEGFFEAGAELAKSCLKNEGKIDFKFYPLLYLYRHGLELALKQLLRWRAELHREHLVGGEPSGHSILDLWISLRSDRRADSAVEHATIESAFEYELRTRLSDLDVAFEVPYSVSDVDALIRDLHDLDPGSVSFRYPKTQRGAPLLADVESVCVRTAFETLVPLGVTFVAWMAAMQNAVDGVRYNRRARQDRESGELAE